MALGGKALGNGWHDQAARFAGMHGMTKTKSFRSAAFGDEVATGEADLAHELEVASTRIAALERRLSQETTATQTLREHMQLLATQFDAAELRATELETELAAAQDRVALHDNESESLQTSLDLAIAENARLSQRLDLSDAALEDACAELARQQAACTKATGEHSKLAQEVFTANGKRLNETAELKEDTKGIKIEEIKTIEEAIEKVATLAGEFGSVQDRLQYTQANQAIYGENLSAAQSSLVDANMAAEMSNFTKGQVLQQADVAILAQANSLPQAVLQLVEGR